MYVIESIVKAAKVQPSVFKTEEKPKGEIEPGNKVKKAVVSPKQEPNREIVSVDLSTDYKDVLQKLEKDSRPLLAFLKEHQSLGQDYHFFTLTPDVTRFLLRQQEKSVNDQSVEALVSKSFHITLAVYRVLTSERHFE